MNRPEWLAAILIVLAPATGFAQFGGMGGMGGQGMAPGMMGNRMMAGPIEVQRTVQVELEGGQRIGGRIDLRPLTAQGDLGRYTIMPDKIKTIRFLKPASEDQAGHAPGGEVAPIGPPIAAPGMRQPPGMFPNLGNAVPDPNNPGSFATMARGKVITTSGQEIIGNIYIPYNFQLQLDFGTLTPSAAKLRSITFTDGDRTAGPGKPDASLPRAPGEVPDTSSMPPRYFRHQHSVIVVSPAGDRVTLFNLETRKSQSIELSGSKGAPLEVTPILGPDLVALALKGPKIDRIAVADLASGTWHAQDLREPARGGAEPIIAPGVAVYSLGRYAYAYSVAAHRWDFAELPEGLRAAAVVGPTGASIEGRGHIYTFIPRAGKWEHIDVRAILDVAGAEGKR
jgi:hypothetical protein